MSCGGCEQTVESALTELDGVTSATADNESNTVSIEGDFDVEAAVDSVEKAGYDASV